MGVDHQPLVLGGWCGVGVGGVGLWCLGVGFGGFLSWFFVRCVGWDCDGGVTATTIRRRILEKRQRR